MIKTIIRNTLLVLVLTGLLVVPSFSQAATQTVAISNLGYEEDLVVTGARTHATIQFPLPAAPVLPGSMVNAIIEPGKQLSGGSSFALYLDNRLINTVTAAQLRANPTVQLPLPANVKGGQPLRLDIKANVFATDDIVADWLNGHLFYTVRNHSNMTLNYIQPPVKTTADFFLRPQNGFVIIIPDTPTMGEMAAGSWVFGILQKSFPYQPVKLVFASERHQYANYPRIWVATRSHLPLQFGELAGGTALADPETLIITGDEDAELKAEVPRITAMLTQGPLSGAGLAYNQSGGAVTDKHREVVYFGQDVSREGIVSVPIEFPVYPAMLAEAPRRLAFHLEGSYSVSHGKQPRLAVLFNGNLIYSEVLDGSGTVRRDVTLPQSVALCAKNVLRVEFNYPDAKDYQGLNGLVQKAQIHTSSYYAGIGAFPKNRYSWDTIGLLANKNGLILLDDQPSTDKVKGAAEAVAMINRQLPSGEFAFPDFRAISDFRDEANVSYMLVVGTAGDIPDELLKNMPLPSIKDGTIFHDNISYNRDRSRNPVIGQVGRYRDIPVVMIVAAADSARLPASVRHLNTNRHYSQLTGNVFILGEEGSLMSVDSREKRMFGSFQQDWIDSLIIFIREAIRWIEQYRQPLWIVLGVILAAVAVSKLAEGNYWRRSRHYRQEKSPKPL